MILNPGTRSVTIAPNPVSDAGMESGWGAPMESQLHAREQGPRFLAKAIGSATLFSTGDAAAKQIYFDTIATRAEPFFAATAWQTFYHLYEELTTDVLHPSASSLIVDPIHNFTDSAFGSWWFPLGGIAAPWPFTTYEWRYLTIKARTRMRYLTVKCNILGSYGPGSSTVVTATSTVFNTARLDEGSLEQDEEFVIPFPDYLLDPSQVTDHDYGTAHLFIPDVTWAQFAARFGL